MSLAASTSTGAATPLKASSRIPGPDLARGFMLLLIILANTPYYLFGGPRSESSAHPASGTLLDQIVQGTLITTVDMRVYPMFAFLFGYGLVMIARRQKDRGLNDQQVRRLVQVRNAWFIVFGAAHALLLWGGDVLGAYGLTGLIVVWLFMRRSNRTLIVWSIIGAALLLVGAALSGMEIFLALTTPYVPVDAGVDLAGFAYASIAAENVFAAALARAVMWPVQIIFVQGLLGLIVPVSILLGFWAARRQVLERPRDYRGLLWTTAIIGILIGWGTGLIHALANAGVLTGLEGSMAVFYMPQMFSGLACGLGYVAVFGLIGGRLAGRPLRPIGYALTAVGKRSMTCYLAQSVLCAPLLAAWGFGLGAELGSASMAVYGVVVWIVTVVYAVILEKRGAPGPAEALLRRLTYGTRAA